MFNSYFIRGNIIKHNYIFVQQGLGAVKLYSADPDPFNTNPTESVIKFKISELKIYQ